VFPRLALLHFRDVLVTPYTELLGRSADRGGPRWPDWSTQTAARFCRGGVPVDDKPPEMEPSSSLADRAAWGGAVAYFLHQGHFGHQIADFSTRLLPTVTELPDVRFAFGVKEEFQHELTSGERIPAFFWEILDWYGIGSERVDIIGQPTLVERLVVAPQAEQLGGPGPDEWYLDLLDDHTASRLGPIERNGSLYVSRATQNSHFAGEKYLERVLQDTGFQVFYPETVTVEEQLRTFAAADSLIIAEGSALHVPQLMGRALGDVTVLVRHAGWRLAEVELTPRARSLRYLDAVRGVLHAKDLDSRGGQAMFRALHVLDADRLEAGLPFGSAWTRKSFDAAVEADVAEWVEEECATKRWQLPGSAEQVCEQLNGLGFSHLVP
jgi:hypothetical protein